VNENTALLMKVHTSNYHIEGFTKTVEEADGIGSLGSPYWLRSTSEPLPRSAIIGIFSSRPIAAR
jgi:hypothetical protein